jgi:toxin-antitoxin system PIN domain toxin
MILADANLLIYAYNDAAEQHLAARKWLEDSISGDEPFRLSWTTVHTFLRLTTERTLLTKPLGMSEAADIVDEWFQSYNVAILQPGPRYWPIFRNVLLNGQIRGALVMDAHLAALAIEHGATLYTTDKDFSRFDGLRVVNPLSKK